MYQKMDKTFAHKAINIAADLSAADRRVAGALIDHYNKLDGQCDPGNERLADLLGIDVRTVRRATQDLCVKHGLFSKVSHGGKSHRTAYTPIWTKFREIVADWDARSRARKMSSGDGGNRAETPASTGRDCPVEQGETALQTLISNPLKKPLAPSGASVGDDCVARTGVKEPRRQNVPVSPNGVRSGSVEQPRRSFERKPAVVVSASHGEAAKAQAMRRIDADLRQLGWQAHGDAAERMTQEISDAAMSAEIARRGGGLRLLIDRLGPSLLRSAAAAGGKS